MASALERSLDDIISDQKKKRAAGRRQAPKGAQSNGAAKSAKPAKPANPGRPAKRAGGVAAVEAKALRITVQNPAAKRAAGVVKRRPQPVKAVPRAAVIEFLVCEKWS